MTYATFRSQGLFIGSGIIEVGCETVVAKRSKNSGVFSSIQGAQNILDLRTSLLRNRFDSQWTAKIFSPPDPSQLPVMHPECAANRDTNREFT